MNELAILLDRLVQADASFALYRLPWTDKCRLVWQLHGKVTCLDRIDSLGYSQGFVMAPFCPSSYHPVVLIRPDVQAQGWDEITHALRTHLASGLLEESSVDIPTIFNESMITPDNEQIFYRNAFQRFITPLRAGLYRKLVLSRASFRQIPVDFSLITSFRKACSRYPRMMVYLCHTPVTGTWMGSTPEILLSGEEHSWHTVALAGTMPMQGETMPTDWSEKNRIEQACVADYIRHIILSYGDELTEEGPYTTRAGGVVHLKTDFYFLLRNSTRLGSLLDELHPTPAVCGLPKADTYRFINTYEGYDRSYYSGFVGCLQPSGHTDLFVNLRCMEVFPHAVRLYAGGGILPQSDPVSEWQETEVKMNTMLSVL
ncbi:isochorismate synthase EntC [gut metagenome]|uniref:isochorismate synthase n=1 Tax=gut metagenome TaxID=749906 RepID=J9FPJ4_9ZZZZ